MRKEILNWLIRNNLRSLEDIGKVMNLYYTNKPFLLEIVRKNQIGKIK